MKKILSLMICLMMSFASVSAKSIYLSQTTAYMGVGGTVTLKLKNASGTIKWTSASKAIATVSKGKVTGKKLGQTKITATHKKKTYVCTVYVVKPVVKELGDFSKRISYTTGLYDLTGDGQKDLLFMLVNRTAGKNNNLMVRLNDKWQFSLKPGVDDNGDPLLDMVHVYYIQLENQHTYLMVTHYSDNGREGKGIKMYTYKDGALKEVRDVYQKLAPYYAGGCIIATPTVKNNVVKLEIFFEDIMIGIYSFTLQLKESNSFAMPTSTAVNYSYGYGYAVANTSIKAYKTAGGSKVAGTIKKNTKVYIKNIVFKGSTLYYKVKFGSKTGYIKSMRNRDDRYFRGTPTGM